nr:TfuA-like protein [uncultured Gellertiella sp.]
MKVVFAGPTVPDAASLFPALEVRPPARQGDLYLACQQGATVIGLIDGYFEYVQSVWHKEILYALSGGCQVLGAASMGALRAAECAAYGMQPIGVIADTYLNGLRIDDADVAQSHAPAELGYAALSEPLVNIDATLDAMLDRGLVTPETHAGLARAARELFFKDRTWPAVVRQASRAGMQTDETLLQQVQSTTVNRKRLDALLLLDTVSAMPDRLGPCPSDWTFLQTHGFRQYIQSCDD